MDNDDEKRKIDAEIKRREIEDNINNIIIELVNIDKKLNYKNEEAKSVEIRLKEAEKEYDKATTEGQIKETKNIYLQVLDEYDNVYNKYNSLQEEHKVLIYQLKDYISLHKDELNKPESIKEIEDYIDEFLANMQEAEEKAKAAAREADLRGGKRKTKGNSKKVAKKPVASQKKQSIYKEIFGKQMKIYKMPDSRKEYVKYKGDLHLITDYKSLIMKQKANAKPKAKPKPKK